MSELHELTMHALGDLLLSKEVSSVDATQACLQRIYATQHLNAYLHVDEQGALAQAQAADARRSRQASLGPLDGVPLALKDILLTQDQPTTCASKILQGFVPPYDATVVRKLKAAGAVLLGKVNMDEFAMGSSNENSAYGPVQNPWDTTRVPGGSSGGSAAVVAAGSAFASLGTDTGGSIRQPAHCCNIVGLKPTYGRVSRYGVIAYASSLDQVGPMSKDVIDCAMLLQAISGVDPHDATSANQAVPNFVADLNEQREGGIAGLRLGVPKEYFGTGIDPEVRKLVEAAIKAYERLGAQLIDVSLPHTAYGIATYYVLASAEASSNLARYDGVRYGHRAASAAHGSLLEMYTQSRSEGFGAEVKQRILLGTYVLSAGFYEAYYVQAQKVRTLVKHDFAEAFNKVDALIAPVAPKPAKKLGHRENNPVAVYIGDACTVTANLAGLPAMSVPCGFTPTDNLPVGHQLLAPTWQEATLLRLAYAYEREHAWHLRRP